MKIDKLIMRPNSISESKIYYCLPYPMSDLASSMIFDLGNKVWYASGKVHDISGEDNYPFVVSSVREAVNSHEWMVYEVTEKEKDKLLMIEEMLK